MSENDQENKILKVSFHGRVLHSLGIDMYQSPIAAIAEIISNSWDADAEEVKISLPDSPSGQFCITDNGHGMTFSDCENRFLKVGYCRRIEQNTDKSRGKNRQVMGRKGIGKFAGFGIAREMEIKTISAETGETTEFVLSLEQFEHEDNTNGDNENIESIAVKKYLPPNEENIQNHGTTIILRKLTIQRTPSVDVFLRGIGKRFQLSSMVSEFKLQINGRTVPDDNETGIQFKFPRDYREDERPNDIKIQDDWACESLKINDSELKPIKWKIFFSKEPIKDEYKGVAVFAHLKQAQAPFLFNISGSFQGQHGQEYITGQVCADYIDKFKDDMISTERQRINWGKPETTSLLIWGQGKIKELLALWHKRRGENRAKMIETKVAAFSERLEKLRPTERNTVSVALKKLGAISTLSDDQFTDLGKSLLTAWEKGRLRELIDSISSEENVSTDWLLNTLVEANVLVALNYAEAIKAKMEAVRALKKMVDEKLLENSIRDFIAEHPYLLDDCWETYKKEISLQRFLDEAAKEAKLTDELDGDGSSAMNKRMDLCLKSNANLLVVEFMRPGLTVDWDHISRCERYITILREKIFAETALDIKHITGLIVADNLVRKSDLNSKIKSLAKDDIRAFEWKTLLEQSLSKYSDYLALLKDRSPEDVRLKEL